MQEEDTDDYKNDISVKAKLKGGNVLVKTCRRQNDKVQ